MPDALLRYLAQAPWVEELSAWAAIESCSRDAQGLAQMRVVLEQRLRRLGAAVERVGSMHLLARWPGVGQPILLLGHFDTVYPRGTLVQQPIAQRDGGLFGPGVLDMKGGLLMGCLAIEALQALDRRPRRPVWFLCTGDEEVGSPDARPWIERYAREAAAVLVLEAAGNGGALKTARKGVGLYELVVTGRAAHAGVAPEQGRSALLELAHQIIWLHTLNDAAQGTTVNVCVAQGGTATNVVPAEARAAINIRVRTLAEAERIAAALQARQAVLDGVTLCFSGGLNRPPMERSAAIARLFARAQALARELGFELSETETGGGSDGNFTAALGVPTLDGLGPVGGGAHARHEHVQLASLAPRTALLARLLETL
ncbi:M20 family metallopeptidase [Kallotenue papyrolyticum]|uniref:M20 family metallopeptidase n=1 Tax=Kallotenue papyrolyticum TaxID=1325125 RepID=UPI00047862C9|nr:M20 family metallopeptidase [Kallotenue papyrolyticum]